MSFLKVAVAADVLRAGGVIAHPTEAVWGLACDPQNAQAVSRLLQIKRRDPAKGLILVAASIEQFHGYLDGLSPELTAILTQAWPGPYTYIVPDNGFAPALIKGGFSSVALRVSNHKQVVALCRAFGGPIVSTSANITGRSALVWPWLVNRQLGQELNYLLPGQLGCTRRPSEIRDLISGKVMRQG